MDDNAAVIGFDANEVFRSASLLAAKGIQVVRLYGVREHGSCTCGNANCATPGKHPAGGPGWPNRATTDEDEIASWLESDEPFNIGIKLGRDSGIIDIEVDSPEAQEVLEQFRLQEVDTPTYRASRGEHRLFRFDDRLPDVAVVKVGGLEVRTGGGGRAAQSVAPGSWHASGRRYEWLPGKSIDDVDPAPIPEAFLQAILQNSTKKGSGVAAQARAATAAGEKITAGGRHAYLLGEATDLFYRAPVLDEQCRNRVLRIVRLLNAGMCDPPKGDDEIVAIVDSQMAFFRRARQAGLPDLRPDEPGAEERLEAARHPWEKYGLERQGDGWGPGAWRVTIVRSDPIRYRLTLPSPTGGDPITVNLASDEWLKPQKIAERILAATGTFNVFDPEPKQWARAWCGYSRRGGAAIRGICPQLTGEPYATEEIPPPELRRSAAVAGLLLDHLGSVPKPTSETDTKPSPHASPKWLYHHGREELWFHWPDVWRGISEAAEAPPTAQEKQNLLECLLRELGDREIPVIQPRLENGQRKRLYRFTARHMGALARLTGIEEAA